MRVLSVALAVLASGSLRVCDTDKDTGPDKEATVSAEPAAGDKSAKQAATATATARARLGGSVVLVGEHSVELLLHKDGLAEALVSDASGKAVATSDVKLSVTATAASGPVQIALAHDPEHLCFRGRAGGAAELSVAPVAIALSVNGKAAKATLAEYALVTGPRFGGTVLVAGTYGAELRATSTSLHAHLTDAAGVEIKGDGKLRVDANVAASTGAAQTLSLAYDPIEAAFVGKAAAGVQFAPGPLTLEVNAGGKAHLGALASLSLQVAASHGGTIVTAGDYSVELVVDGESIAAYVFDASGKAAARADLSLELSAGVNGAEKIALTWDPPSASFKGKASANLKLETTPLQLSLKAGGRAFVGAVHSLKANAKLAARADANAEANLAGAAKVSGPALKTAAHVSAEKQASAAVKLSPPKVEVKKSASASAGGGKAKASAGFSFGTK
jgi:hypothetical protein